jgi:transcriptional antiterminator RfaH
MNFVSSPTRVSRWYCLRAQARREHIAAANLSERIAVEVFAPRIKSVRPTRGGLVKGTTEALFPGYLFAHFAYPEQVRHVVSTCGVTGIVSFGAQPPAIADSVIEYLRHETAQAEQMPAAPVLAEGAWVKILSGCFQYIEGRVLHFDPRTERIRLLLTLLGSEVQVSVAAKRVALLTDPPPNYPSGLMAERPSESLRLRHAV